MWLPRGAEDGSSRYEMRGSSKILDLRSRKARDPLRGLASATPILVDGWQTSNRSRQKSALLILDANRYERDVQHAGYTL